MTNPNQVTFNVDVETATGSSPPASETGGNGAEAAVVTWKDLHVYLARKKSKVLLNGVSGQIDGGFWAVMGPSGSGKSTLLNALACRLDVVVRCTGEMRLNGRPYSNTELKRMAGYVMQDDLLNGNLTVQETLWFNAQLRLPKEFTAEQRQERIDEVAHEVGLDHAKNTIVGDPLRKGISGGERKRLCVAIELLTHPSLLFLDEPTSGLDSVTALSLCRTLRELAASGKCTVVCTIHQPQSKIFHLFDNLILLKSGNIVYSGPTLHAVKHFEEIGFPCPELTNPADHLLDVITPYKGDSQASLYELDKKLKGAYSKPDVDLMRGLDMPLKLIRDVIPWHKQYLTLLKRTFKECIRKYAVQATIFASAVLFAILIGAAFLQIGNDQVSQTKRQPMLFFCVINQGIFAALMTINSFPGERILILRERQAGSYHVSAYFLAKITAESLLQLPAPILFSIIVYPMVGLQADVTKFFIFMLFMILCGLAATSLALMVSALCRTVDLSLTVLPLVLELGRLFGSFFLPPSNLPSYFVWLDAISYVKYTYVGISLNELAGLDLYCDPSKKKVPCAWKSGQDIIEAQGFDSLTIGGCIGALVVFIVITRVIAYLGVRFIKW